MGRPKKLLSYNPNLTAKENAKKNGVSIYTVYSYTQKYGIDRRAAKKNEIIKRCQEYLKSHPNATLDEISKATGYTAKTIRGYKEIISGEECVVSNENKTRIRNSIREDEIKAQKTYLESISTEVLSEYLTGKSCFIGKPIKRNGKPLWSEEIENIPRVLQLADKQDISGLREFLLEKPEMPMLFVGSGGQQGSLPSLFYGMYKGVGLALTPLQFAALSDDAVKNSRIMLLSHGGHNDDIKYASKRAVKLNPHNTACITFGSTEKNCLIKNLKDTSARIFLFDKYRSKASLFVGACGKFYRFGLFYRAYTGADTVSDKIRIDYSNNACFHIQQNGIKDGPINLERVEHFFVLYGSYGEPVAHDIESVFTESGLASVHVTDYRNYCHGQFIFATNHTENVKEPRYYSNIAMVLLISPRERTLASNIRDLAIPSKTPIITIETEYDDVLATLDLFVKASVFIGYFGEEIKRINPCSPPNYNAKDVEKQNPIYGIKFIKELKDSGELRYCGPLASKADDDLLEKIKALKDDESINSENLQHYPCPVIEDLTRWEEYDASHYLCYAFKKKGDLRKGQWIPFGNMNKDFPFELCGNHCETSESAYICGMFSNNTPEHITIQEALLKETNGRKAKKDIRQKNEAIGRKDWYDFNVQWMLYVVWTKIQGNQHFRDLLMAVPEGAIIIEDTTFQHGPKDNDTTQFWGAKNQQKKEYDSLIKKRISQTDAAAAKLTKKRMKADEVNDFCDYGTYEGRNVMGKILTICRKCLQDGSTPSIDYKLLRSKNIHLLGVPVSFDGIDDDLGEGKKSHTGITVKITKIKL